MTMNLGGHRLKPPVVLTIAGFDPSNGAGVTADLQVFSAHGLFGTAAITSLTVQSTVGVAAVEPVAAPTLRHTLEHLAADLPPDGIKIGMLGNREAVAVVASFLRELRNRKSENVELPVVFDPVMQSSSGAALLEGNAAIECIQAELLPLVSWITPNFAELQMLVGNKAGSTVSAEESIQVLGERYSNLHLVATGGDRTGQPIDLWRTPDGTIQHLYGERVETTSTHGTGCAFSSALLSELVLGSEPSVAIARAKQYVERALRSAPAVGHGRGPLDLLWPLWDGR